MPPRFDSSIASLPATNDRRWWILGVLVLSLVIVMTANSSLNLAIPSLVRDTNASSTELQWIVDAYALVFAGLLLTAGAMGDRYGRKGMLMAGLAIFGSMSALATTATSPTTLIAIRAVQGAGAALIMPGTLSILAAAFPPHERTRAIAIWAGFASSGAALGIIGSGWLLEHYWWGSVFLVNVPIVATSLILVAALVPTSRDPRRTPLDVPGAAVSIVALGALLYGIIEAPEQGWTDPQTLAAFGLAALASVLFVMRELRAAHPMLDLRFFARPGFSIGTATISMTFFAMFGMWFLMTQYLQSVRGFTPLEAGIRTLPMVVTMMIAAPRSARLVARFGNRTVLTVGLGLVASAFVVLATIDAQTDYWVIAVGFICLGAGMGNVTAPATGAIMTALPIAKAGVGSAVNDTAREVGGSLGIAVLGSILAAGYRHDVASVPGLAPESATTARQSIGAALQEATRLGGDNGARLADAARSAYVNALSLSLLVAAVAIIVTIVVVQRSLPRTAASPAHASHDVPSPADGSDVGDLAAEAAS
jgi:EmrB/QacA subfamily drug resistance transporter